MGQTDMPDDRRAAGSRLPSNSESAVKRNHETPKSGIQKRKKIEACPRLSCKIQYLLASNHRDQSTTSEYFTDDYLSDVASRICDLSRGPDETLRRKTQLGAVERSLKRPERRTHSEKSRERPR